MRWQPCVAGISPPPNKSCGTNCKRIQTTAGFSAFSAVALDSQGKSKDAEAFHRRALAGAPKSPDVLNNYANHLLGVGDEEGARKQYLKVTSVDPANRNANVQLARSAIKRRNGGEALAYLGRLPDGAASNSSLAPLRLAALYLTGETAEADALAATLAASAKTDSGLSSVAGTVLADAGQFDRAAGFWAQALALAPSDFGVLCNLAVVVSHTGDHRRARELLETALGQQPQNVEVLYLLAHEDQALGQSEAAVGLLARAAKLAPQRADVQKLLALATSDLGALEDATAAWNRYLKLVPNDDEARRERGYLAVQMGQFEKGMADLRWFVARHPNDAVGHYELGFALSKDDPAQGLVQLDKALALRPDFVPARSARGSLYYQSGKPEAALPDLEAVVTQQPGDPLNLDRLGQTYLALDRTEDALTVLRKAAELAPGDAKTQLHFARALADAGRTDESKAAMERFRQLPPAVNKAVPGGLVDYLSLTPQQRRADYRARVEKLVREHPEDAAALGSYVKLMLDDGKTDQAVAAAHRLAALKPVATVLAGTGRALLEAKQYGPAKQLLELAATEDVAADLALASFYAVGAADGLKQSDRVPEARRTGDDYLARVLMLHAAGRSKDAASALEMAVGGSPRRKDLYQQVVALSMENGHAGDALRLLARAGQVLPGDREIELLRATVLELSGQTDDAERLFGTLQSRWPEWPAVWAAHGMALAAHGRADEARRTFDTAIELGAHSPEMQTLTIPPDDYLSRLLREKPPRDW